VESPHGDRRGRQKEHGPVEQDEKSRIVQGVGKGQPVAKGQARQAHDGGVDPLVDPDDHHVPEAEEQEEIPEFASVRATAEDGVASKAASGGSDQRREDHDSPRLAGLTSRNQGGGIFLQNSGRTRGVVLRAVLVL